MPRIFKPAGVVLSDPDDHDFHRQDIFTKVHEAVKQTFPKVHAGVRLELAESDYEGPDRIEADEEKDALLRDRYPARKLRGKVRLFDDKTNELLDEQKLTLMNVPVMTQRGTFVHKGSSYTSIKQPRLLPGPYGRFMDNGQVEVHFNVKPGTGPSYRVRLDPGTAQFRMSVGPQAEVHLYSVLKDMGVSDDELKAQWGEGTWQRNSSQYNPRAFNQLYTKLVPLREQNAELAQPDKIKQMQAALERSQVLRNIMDQHLPSGTKAAALKAELQATHSDDDPKQVLAKFRPDLKPDEMREARNAIYGRAGPQLASMKAWPKEWINQDVDPLGWMEWYEQYHSGRRTDDDPRQIRRWLAFKRRHGTQFAANPTPRRAYALRNWAIDPLRLVEEERRDSVKRDMDAYRDRAWQDWAKKKARFMLQDLQALGNHLNNCSNAGINLDGSSEELEQAVHDFLFNDAQEQRGDSALMSAAMAVKGAMAGHHLLNHPDSHLDEDGGRVWLKTASTRHDVTDCLEDIFYVTTGGEL